MTRPRWDPADETANPCDVPDVAVDPDRSGGSPRDTSRLWKLLADEYDRRDPWQGRRGGGLR